MNTPPMISVVTICRNAEDLIGATMDSVLNQSYPSIEYIIIDGVSKDRTLEIVNATASRYPHRTVQVFSEPDSGISDAMNKGIQRATGEVIAHLHAGDRYIDHDSIEAVMQSYQQSGWRWGIAQSIVVDQTGAPKHLYSPEQQVKALAKKNFVPHQSTFVHADVFKRHGLFDTQYKQAMDYEFWLRIAFKGKESFTVLPFPTTYFLDGGRSSNLRELLSYLHRIRLDAHSYGVSTNRLKDFIFLSRVALFHLYYQTIKRF